MSKEKDEVGGVVVDLQERRARSIFDRPILTCGAEGEDMREWVGWSDEPTPGRVLLVAVQGSDGGPDVGRLLSPDQARELGLALIGAATLASHEFRAQVKGGKP